MINLKPRRISKRSGKHMEVLGGVHGYVEVETFVAPTEDGGLKLMEAQYRPYLSGAEYKPVRERGGVFWRDLEAAVGQFAKEQTGEKV